MKPFVILVLLLTGLLSFTSFKAANSSSVSVLNKTNSHTRFGAEQKKERPNHLIKFFRKKYKHSKQVMAALLALPLPFGVLALHRIYLGTKPFVPVVYIATIGGVFGILPFIDFCILLFDRDIERFKNNGKVFMWIE